MNPPGKTMELRRRRWATRLLVENAQVPQGGIDMMNRCEMGSALA